MTALAHQASPPPLTTAAAGPQALHASFLTAAVTVVIAVTPPSTLLPWVTSLHVVAATFALAESV